MPKTPLKTQTAAPKKQPLQPKNANNGLTELLVAGLRELYWAENHLVLNLPKIQEAAGNTRLRKIVADHLQVTRGHVKRLEQALTILGESPLAQKCDGMEGLVMEGEGIIDTTRPGSDARLTGLIMACQKVETYEITAYKGLALLATQLDHEDIANLLQATMAEEQEANDTLAQLAQQH